MVYFLKIVAIFVALLFLDAARTGYTVVLQPEKEGFNSGLDGCVPGVLRARPLAVCHGRKSRTMPPVH
jgi:hypothetical protein